MFLTPQRALKPIFKWFQLKQCITGRSSSLRTIHFQYKPFHTVQLKKKTFNYIRPVNFCSSTLIKPSSCSPFLSITTRSYFSSSTNPTKLTTGLFRVLFNPKLL